MKAISLCISRFDAETKETFLDLYTKVDEGVEIESLTNNDSDDDDEEEEEENTNF